MGGRREAVARAPYPFWRARGRHTNSNPLGMPFTPPPPPTPQRHVVGIMHTNYLAYIAEGPGPSAINVAALYRVNKWVVRMHCHKVRVGGRGRAKEPAACVDL